MNKHNLKNLSPRQFPKRQYNKLTLKIRLVIITVLAIILIGGGISSNYWYNRYKSHSSQVVHTHKSAFTRPKKAAPSKHRNKLKAINVKQGEHLLGYWLRQLHYSTDKSKAILLTYQRNDKSKELQFSQTLNQLTHRPGNHQTKVNQIRHLISQRL